MKEQKEPVPGWLITKVVKQPPLKEEHSNIVQKPQSPTTPHPQSPVIQKTKRVVHRPGTPPQHRHKTSTQNSNSTDLNNNNNNITTTATATITTTATSKVPADERLQRASPKNSAVSQRIQQFTTTPSNGDNNNTNNNTNSNKKMVATRTDTSEIEEILRNVRTINKTHLNNVHRRRNKNTQNNPESGSEPVKTDYKWKPPTATTTTTNRKRNQDETQQILSSETSDSSASSTPTPPPQSTPTPPLVNNFVSDSNESTTVIHHRDLNNNSNLQSVEQAQALGTPQNENNVNNNGSVTPTIKTIKISKKTLELNVKQFTQYSRETDGALGEERGIEGGERTNTTHHHTTLKPLQLKFNFSAVRKKRPYKEKQQTRSLTDVTVGDGTEVNTQPNEEQMLSPRHRCNKNCDIVNGQCKVKADLVTGKQHHRRTVVKPPRIQHYSFLSIPETVTIPEITL